MGGWTGSGTVTLTYDWTDDRDNAIPITASRVEGNEADLISAIEATLNLDGENTMRAALKMGGYKLLNIADGASLTDGVSLKQLQNGAGQYAVDSGAADAYAITLSPAVTAYATGQAFLFKASNTNTGASTLAVNGLAAKSLVKLDGATALVAGDIISGGIYLAVYDGTNFQVVGAQLYDQSLNTTDNVEFVSVEAYRPFDSLDAVQTFALVDANRLQRLTGSTNRTWTIPANASVAFPTGSEIEVFNDGTGTLTLTADTGVTINAVTAGSIDLTANQGGVLKKVDTDRWIYMGDSKGDWA